MLLPVQGQRLSPLAPTPAWQELEPFQETITREEFLRLLGEVYAPGDAWRDFIEVQPGGAEVKTTLTPAATWSLRFATDAANAKPIPRLWRPANALGPAPQGQPLAGVKIAIDPGHVGGKWAQMEERFFQIGESRPVAEGEMTLRVAELLAPRLQALGAEVSLVRRTPDPVTPQRPETLRDAARAELTREAGTPPSDASVARESELLFYRMSEIRRRAEIVNTELHPDLTLCLHFNAEAWGDPKRPQFVPRNHLHVLLNGCYSASELRHDDVRFEMLMKLLSRSFAEEAAAAEPVAAALARDAKLPPFFYNTGNAIRVGGGGYLWARNLLANRLYRTPVIFLEPYVMNSELVWARVQMGDYEGENVVGSESRKSIFREYADAVADGLREYYTRERKPQP